MRGILHMNALNVEVIRPHCPFQSVFVSYCIEPYVPYLTVPHRIVLYCVGFVQILCFFT